MTERFEPTTWQIQASYKSKANTKLAHQIFPLITFGTYDRFSAHRWVLKLIAGNPNDGEQVATTLTNFDWMVDGARTKYLNSTIERRRMNEVARLFTAWKLEQYAKEQAA